jgi:hypothetical protein
MKFFAILIAAMLIAGCGSGGGGSSSNFVSGNPPFGGSGVTGGSGGSIPLTSNPEPTTLALLGIGLAGLAVAALKKKR